jgi:hypothetical protein
VIGRPGHRLGSARRIPPQLTQLCSSGTRMRTHRVSISFGQVAVAVMLATSVACTSVPSGTRATNAEPMRSADSASAGPSASASSQLGYRPATPSGDISSSAGPSESPTSPRVLPSSASGKDLSLTDIFASKGEWKQARFDLADQTDVPGMGVALNTCGTYNPAELELRLAHRFMHLSMNVAQANDSPSSSNKIVVEVTANGNSRTAGKCRLIAFSPSTFQCKTSTRPSFGCG